jgi:murein L,D-transpeptidase YafK
MPTERKGNPLRLIVFSVLLLAAQLSWAMDKADNVLVIKSQCRLFLLRDGKTLNAFHVALGANPEGHKQRQGDGRTPEGSYILDLKNAHSAFYKSIRISYPNAADRARARRRGVDPGGWIMIHGQRNGLGHLARNTQRTHWTNGCIAVTDREMDIIWQTVDVGTPIEIRP